MYAKKMKAVALPTALCTVLALSACGGTDEVAQGDGPAGTLSVNFAGFPESWAPGAEMEAGYMRVPYETLVALDAEGEISPVLATSWEQTDTDLTLTLREGVTFHDGTPFDAEAVKVNLETVRDGTGPYSGPLKVIESIDVVDEHTVRLNLSEPVPSLLTTLTTRVAPMASPAAIEAGTVADHPVGTGPWAYAPDSSTPGTRMAFTFFEDYWDGADSVGFGTIELFGIEDGNTAVGALTSGELDITGAEVDLLERVEGTPGIESLTYPAIRNNVIFFDRGPGGVFEDADLRRAACYALETDALPEVIVDLSPQPQHFAEGEPGYNPDTPGYPHNLDRARELYEDAGSPEVNVEMIAAPFNQRQMEVYSFQLAEIGFEVTVQGAPPPQFFSSWASGQYPLGMGSNDELTPYDWYRAWFAADAPGNPAGVESEELAEAAEAAIAAGTSEEAEGLWAEVTRIISDEALTCGHVVSQEMIMWQSQTVESVTEPTQPWEPNLVDFKNLRPTE
ncbi:putative D,D-dipeptide-binding periplasmic protein DdpA [Nocardiopsis dassonvillei]|uniref:ABC transporter substrate-binding protein n=1 Tax=Nocardiopsis dassonvillei TaxID=2014 RepID=UPI003F57A905